jgi:type I restriction enzyme R subunit
VVRQLLADVEANGSGKKYLIQHSAGSGKSNSIAWLTHQLVRIERETDGVTKPVFDSVIVVTDRKILDKQIRDTIKQFAQVSSLVGHAEKSSDLRDMITVGKKIIITTVQKFPYIIDAIGDEHRDRTFGIVIDEAHSSQSGRTATALSRSLQAKKVVDAEAVEGAEAILKIADGELADPATGRPKSPEIVTRAYTVPAPAWTPGKGRPDARVERPAAPPAPPVGADR